jgi:ABC-type bacteriocin/lantibiotic exporter with double-glycine peptidase domain
MSLCAVVALAALTATAPARDLVVPEPAADPRPADGAVTLPVPVIEQARQRCGPAALQMVMSYYGAGPEALFQARTAYDPVLRGSLITELASAARRAGFDAAVEPMTPDSLVALLRQGVPPILLYQNGRAPFTVRHYGVVTGGDDTKGAFTLNDGTAHPRVTRVSELVKRWGPAGSQALVVRPRKP